MRRKDMTEMRRKDMTEMKRKGKVGMIIVIILAALTVIGVAGAIACNAGTSAEIQEGENLPIAVIDFKKLNNGTYIGEYEGGMFKLRANEVQVTVSSGKVTDIKILKHIENQSTEFTGELYDNIIKAQSLQVDTEIGAIINSKACLKSVEDALIKAQKR